MARLLTAAATAKTLAAACTYIACRFSATARENIRHRSCFAPLNAFETQSQLLAELAVIGGDYLALAALGRWTWFGGGDRAYVALDYALFADAAPMAYFWPSVRKYLSPVPRLDASLAVDVMLASDMGDVQRFAVVHGVRHFVRSVCSNGRRLLTNEGLATWPGVVLRSAAEAALSTSVQYAAAAVTHKVCRRLAPRRWAAYVLTYTAAYAAGMAFQNLVATQLNNVVPQRVQSRLQRQSDALLAGANPVNTTKVATAWGNFSAFELAEVAQFANEAIKTSDVNHNVRLQLVRHLQGLVLYVQDVSSGKISRTRKPPAADKLDRHVFTPEQIAQRALEKQPAYACAQCQRDFVPSDGAVHLPCGHLVHRERCADAMKTDWCPACVRPMELPDNEERMRVHLRMRAYIDELGSEWNAKPLLPPHVYYGEWRVAVEYAICLGLIERGLPLDIIPADHVPGSLAALEVVVTVLLWALNMTPTNIVPHVLVPKRGW